MTRVRFTVPAITNSQCFRLVVFVVFPVLFVVKRPMGLPISARRRGCSRKKTDQTIQGRPLDYIVQVTHPEPEFSFARQLGPVKGQN